MYRRSEEDNDGDGDDSSSIGGGRPGVGRPAGDNFPSSASVHRSFLTGDDDYYAEALLVGHPSGQRPYPFLLDDEYSAAHHYYQQRQQRGGGSTTTCSSDHPRSQRTTTATSESLSMTEQDFLAKYGHPTSSSCSNGATRSTQPGAISVPGAHPSSGIPGAHACAHAPPPSASASRDDDRRGPRRERDGYSPPTRRSYYEEQAAAAATGGDRYRYPSCDDDCRGPPPLRDDLLLVEDEHCRCSETLVGPPNSMSRHGRLRASYDDYDQDDHPPPPPPPRETTSPYHSHPRHYSSSSSSIPPPLPRAAGRVSSQSTNSTSGFWSFYSGSGYGHDCPSRTSSEYRMQRYYDEQQEQQQQQLEEEEQQQMMMMMMRRNRDAAVRTEHPRYPYDHYDDRDRHRRRSPSPPPRRRYHHEDDRAPYPAPPRPSSSHQPITTTTTERPLLELAPGLFMHLMGTDETMKAIHSGDITITSCVCCAIDIYCSLEVEYILCPDCRVVSPVDQLDSNNVEKEPKNGGLVGLGVKTEMLINMMEKAGRNSYY